ncbi:ABC transporter permease [Weizmannia acidilactici]|uniref:ABC transporter permease n=1 Tax=Weizmannia acidilactici TaxID=2607726 RepID=UPI00124BE382|nr:ABC transporter permease [Weizmannia acidilactici]GER67806.1 ABC transporter permease [Weizmannia acidilactici]
MKDVLRLIRNTLSMTFRKKRNFLYYLGLPLIGIFIAFLAYGGNNVNILHVGVVDGDHSKITADTVDFLNGLDNVKLTEIPQSKMRRKLANGKLDCVIIFEKGFSDSVRSGNPAHIRITSIKGAEVTKFIQSYLYQYIDHIASISKAASGNEQAFQTMYQGFQKSAYKVKTINLQDLSKSNDMSYQTMGFLIMFMLMSACNLSELILAEKENRTYFRLLSSPINAGKYVLSNVICNMIIMAVQVALTLVAMKYVFHISMNISIWQAFAVMFLFAWISIGISLMIVSFSNNRSAANSLQNLIIVPTCMLAGCFWPVEIMPKALQKVSDFLPQRWTLETLDQLQTGHPISSLYLNYLILLAFALAFFLLAIYQFSRNHNTQNFV